MNTISVKCEKCRTSFNVVPKGIVYDGVYADGSKGAEEYLYFECPHCRTEYPVSYTMAEGVRLRDMAQKDRAMGFGGTLNMGEFRKYVLLGDDAGKKAEEENVRGKAKGKLRFNESGTGAGTGTGTGTGFRHGHLFGGVERTIEEQ